MAESTAADTLSIHLNRTDLHAIEVPASFATAESFVIELDNHGEATHVHLRLDDALSEIASLPTSNHYVRPGATTRVPISVHDEGPAGGFLTVATAYGSETEDIEITVEPTAGKERVEIDESLIERSGGGGSVESTRSATPTNRTTRPASAGIATSIDTSVLLGGAALLILLGIALLFVQGIALYIGALAVIVGFLVAAYLLLY
jgi:hypothetical protein